MGRKRKGEILRALMITREMDEGLTKVVKYRAELGETVTVQDVIRESIEHNHQYQNIDHLIKHLRGQS